MPVKRGILLVLLWTVFSLIFNGCMPGAASNFHTNDPPVSATATSTLTNSPTPFQALTNTPAVIPPSYTPSATFTPSPTFTPIPTDTPVPSPTPALVWNPAGHVTAPILLYHHVADLGYANRYYIPLNTFRTQMEALRNWGYTSITPSELVDVLINGGELPFRPVVICFDDGNIDIYDNAFPIMREFGFVGSIYIVANRLQSKGFITAEQLQEMANAGWEIGSHAMSHIDLTLDYSTARYEILQSRLALEEATGRPVKTFAYPYGKTDEFISNRVSEYGYQAGMGLGTGFEHSLGTLFYLSRMEIQGDYDFSKFQSLLPWSN